MDPLPIRRTRVWTLACAAALSFIAGSFVAIAQLGSDGPALLFFGAGVCASVMLALQAWFALRAEAR